MKKSAHIVWDPTNERDLYLLELDSVADLPKTLDLPSLNYAVFVAWEAEGQPRTTVEAFLKYLLRSGASHICMWGDGCEWVKEIYDELMDEDYKLNPFADRIEIFADRNETLEETLGLFFTGSVTSPEFARTTRCGLGVSIGSSDWTRRIRQAMTARGELRPFSQGGNARRVVDAVAGL